MGGGGQHERTRHEYKSMGREGTEEERLKMEFLFCFLLLVIRVCVCVCLCVRARATRLSAPKQVYFP